MRNQLVIFNGTTFDHLAIVQPEYQVTAWRKTSADSILLVTSDKRLQLVNTDGKIITISNLPRAWLAHPDIIRGIAVVSENKVALWSENLLVTCCLEKLLHQQSNVITPPLEQIDETSACNLSPAVISNTDNLSTSKRKRRTLKHLPNVEPSSRVATASGKPAAELDFGPHLRVHTNYGKILFFDYLHPSSTTAAVEEAILIERPWDAIENSLPPAPDRKHYGGY
jgi:hypothetical protein